MNGPAATVVSGDPAAVGELVARCEADGVRARVLPVDYASHCAQVDRVRGEVLAALAASRRGRATVPMMSAMTGQWLDGAEAGAAGTGMTACGRRWSSGGPSRRWPGRSRRVHRGLAAPGADRRHHRDAATGTAPVVTGTLRRDDGGPARLLASLAEAHVHGVPVDWATVLADGQHVDLPTYAFQHQRYWLDAPRWEPARSAVSGWRYKVTWTPIPRPGR